MFVPMSAVLRQMAKEKGFDKMGCRRRVTVADLVKMTEADRTALARRVLRQRAK